MDYEEFVQIHQHQLLNSSIPQLYWSTLHKKLSDEVYDAGSIFQMQQVLHTVEHEDGEEEEYMKWRIANISENVINLTDSLHIYLIDHAWTYKLSEARAALQEVPGLVARMAGLMDISVEGKSAADVKEEILTTMWKFNQTYTFGNFEMGSDGALPKWYIMDEFGSRIQHSDDPNFRVVPFFYVATGIGYSLMWPIKEVQPDEEVTRDYADGEQRPLERQARLIPWVTSDLTHVSLVQEEPSENYFKIPGKPESVPSPDFEFPGLPKDRNLKVLVEYNDLQDHLTDQRFEIVKDPKDADILWFMRHFYEFQELSETCPGCLINQFPCENVVTVKNRLAAVARRASLPDNADPLASNPKWLPVTYDLQTELPQFVSHFQQREERGLDNHWICKPWNLARSIDTCVSNNIDQIIRIHESGPKVACKYIEDPVLFYREDIGAKVKFDIRYMVLLSSVKPLKVYAYQVFYLRFAN
ncbi:tubulin--tyrosine ligase-like protein 12, partial [Plakobranchus ocellatus]